MSTFVSKSEKYKRASQAKNTFTAISNIRIVSPFVDRTNSKNKNVVFRKVEANTHGES